MIEELALDTNAAIGYIRHDRQSPPQINEAQTVFIPLTVLGELFYGAACSARGDENRKVVENIIGRWQPLVPSVETARIYGDVRAAALKKTTDLKSSKINDLWIAALCIQHDLPLLTNDAGFDQIPGLTVIHW